MADRYPQDSVLVPEWTRVEDGLPESGAEVTFVVRNPHGLPPSAHHGVFFTLSGTGGCGGCKFVESNTGHRWLSRDDPGNFGVVTHWSPRVGVTLPEDVR